MQNYDVIIVGAGPAGAATALNINKIDPDLAARTLLLEAAPLPREKICAGGITGKGEKQLRKLGLEIETPYAPIDGIRLINRDKVVNVYHRGICKVVRRDEFDDFLARKAAERGATLKDGERVKDIKRDGNGFVVTTSKNEYRTKLVVGADGVASVVRKKTGFPTGPKNTRLFLIETPVDETKTHEFLYRSFTFDFTCVNHGVQGYIWDFPCYVNGKAYLNRGIMDRSPDYSNRAKVVDLFRDTMKKRGVELDEFKIKWFPERGYVPGAQMSRPGVLLVGESVGIDPLLGEGISQCFDYAEIAADEIVHAIKSGDVSFRKYSKRIKRSHLGFELTGAYYAAKLLYGKNFNFWLGVGMESREITDMGMKIMAGEASRNDMGPIKGLLIMLKAILRHLLKPGG